VVPLANVNSGWVGRRRVVNAARQHFVDLATFPGATSTFFPYSQHFVDLAKVRMSKSTKCFLHRGRLPHLPTQRR